MIKFIKNKIWLFRKFGFRSGYRLAMVSTLLTLTGSTPVADHWLQEWNLWTHYGIYSEEDNRRQYIKNRNKRYK